MITDVLIATRNLAVVETNSEDLSNLMLDIYQARTIFFVGLRKYEQKNK